MPGNAPSTKSDEEVDREFVRGMMVASDGDVIFSHSLTRSAAIVENVFGSAAQEVDIVTGSSSLPIYAAAPVVKAAISFLKDHPEAKINVKADALVEESHPLLVAINRAGFGNRIQIGTISRGQRRTKDHFVVGDGTSFFYQVNGRIDNGVAEFGGKEGRQYGGVLKRRFEGLRVQSFS